MIFNKNSKGGIELADLLGFIARDTNYLKWRTWLDLSVRPVTAITGTALYTLADTHYNSANYLAGNVEPVEGEPAPTPTNDQKDELVKCFQLTIALFAYVKMLPSLDAGHSNNGRVRSVGEKERALTAAEAYKDEANILSLAYDAFDRLIDYAEQTAFSEWITSNARKQISTLWIQSSDVFNRYYALNSTRMFFTLVPMLTEAQRLHIDTCVPADKLTAMRQALAATTPTDEQKVLIAVVENHIRPALVFLSLSIALDRLPLSIFPEGIFKTQVVGTVKEQLAADNETRREMSDKFQSTGLKYLSSLIDQVQLLQGAAPADTFVTEPKSIATGFRF